MSGGRKSCSNPPRAIGSGLRDETGVHCRAPTGPAAWLAKAKTQSCDAFEAGRSPSRGIGAGLAPPDVQITRPADVSPVAPTM